MEKTLAELERVQTQILERISKLELSLDLSAPLSTAVPSPNPICDTESRLSSILRTNGVSDFSFKKVPADYYDWPFEARRDALGAASIDHLCKSIVLVNTQAPANVIDCSDRNNSKYYVVVIQYTARFNAETVKNFLYLLNNSQIAKKKFNLRLAPEETSVKLTGFEHNAVTCIGMKTDIPYVGILQCPCFAVYKYLIGSMFNFLGLITATQLVYSKFQTEVPICFGGNMERSPCAICISSYRTSIYDLIFPTFCPTASFWVGRLFQIIILSL